MITIRTVNKAIAARGVAAQLVKGRGYYYFVGDAVSRATHTGVMVFRLNQLTVSEWLDELDRVLATIPEPVGTAGHLVIGEEITVDS
jgi:hypothetical protein